MSTQSNTVKSNPSYPVSTDWEETDASQVGETDGSDKSKTKTKTDISLAELMALIAQTLANFNDIQTELSKTTEGTADLQNKALINAAKKTLQKVVDAMAAAKAAQRKGGIFKKIAMAFTIVVTAAAILASGGALSSAILPAAMLLLTTVKTKDGEGAFNFAVKGIVDLLPPGNYNKELVAALIVTAAATLLGGAGAAALNPAAVAAMTVEISSQVALDSGLPQALGDATGKEWVMWLATGLLMVTMVGSGVRAAQKTFEATQAAGQRTVIAQLSERLASFTGSSVGETQILVQQMTRSIQTFSQLIAGAFQIATGAKIMEAASEGYIAEKGTADLAKNHSSLSLANNSTSELQQNMMELVKEIYNQMASLANSDSGLGKLASLTA